MCPVLTITNNCISCDNCRLICPENAIMFFNKNYIIDQWVCTLCNLCVEICPVDCIKISQENTKNPFS